MFGQNSGPLNPRENDSSFGSCLNSIQLWNILGGATHPTVYTVTDKAHE